MWTAEEIRKRAMRRIRGRTRQIAGSRCIEWTGHKNKGGYPYMFFNGKTRSAARVLYTLEIGPIPGKLVIRLVCRRRDCMNVEHMMLDNR
jgi:hypothetical protein